ncbi:MAG: hypothetical protein A2252_03815 [Elusimicrobia bacterium RIFOXYA2_FULL_39_19]|nr:MAG: hypothetical protein A2252_03815 [Elusimicrobia bacterium RIFOXYA2_FULL_39_19]
MVTYVVFLRGINVGGKNIMKMDVLRAEFEKMGFKSVKTYIQSGNVIFQSSLTDKIEIEKKIEKILSIRFHYEAKVLVRSKNDLENTIKHFPKIFADPTWKHNVIFLSKIIDSKDILKKLETKKEIEENTYCKGALFWSAKMDKITRSNMLKLSTRKEYKEMTVRNINTTKQILELMSSIKNVKSS